MGKVSDECQIRPRTCIGQHVIEFHRRKPRVEWDRDHAQPGTQHGPTLMYSLSFGKEGPTGLLLAKP